MLVAVVTSNSTLENLQTSLCYAGRAITGQFRNTTVEAIVSDNNPLDKDMGNSAEYDCHGEVTEDNRS